jgi:2-phospho-L-lactate guanylyltransferase
VTPATAAEWVVVLPVKGTVEAKSRLVPDAGEQRSAEDRARLAIAFAADTVAAVLAAEGVAEAVVVTSEGSVALFGELGAIVVLDPRAGLNAAIAHGIAEARRRRPDAPVAAMTADLPALRPGDVAAMLELARAHPLAMVEDKDGTGTTTILAAAGIPLVPHFGLDSARLHREAGHVDLPLDRGSRMRLDVDTEDDLALAKAEGLGAYSRALLA